MQTNSRRLREHFVGRLFARRPASVLDVGCGGGALLIACRAADIPAEGVEPDAAGVEACRAEALNVRQCAAAPLPFPDGSFDWVTLRHVPHHLEDPRGAFAEAWRVARGGIQIAEPWYDVSFESQKVAERIDGLLKTFDRARGMFHADALDARALIEMLPEDAVDLELETFLRPRPYKPDDFQVDVDQSLGGLDAPPERVAELAELRAAVVRGGATLNGTLILTVRRPARGDSPR